MLLEIRNDIPLPVKGARAKRSPVYDALAKLDVGQSLVVDEYSQKLARSVGAICGKVAKANGVKFMARRMKDDANDVGMIVVWRTA